MAMNSGLMKILGPILGAVIPVIIVVIVFFALRNNPTVQAKTNQLKDRFLGKACKRIAFHAPTAHIIDVTAINLYNKNGEHMTTGSAWSAPQTDEKAKIGYTVIKMPALWKSHYTTEHLFDNSGDGHILGHWNGNGDDLIIEFVKPLRGITEIELKYGQQKERMQPFVVKLYDENLVEFASYKNLKADTFRFNVEENRTDI